MGYSARTKDWRYTEWVDRDSKQVVARELYDHRGGQPETKNVAVENQADVKRLASLLREKISALAHAGGSVASPAKPQALQNFSSTVFDHNDGGTTDHGYRIPSVVVSSKGTLLSFCERRIGLHDHAKNDIVLRRSIDGGRTWGAIQVIADDGSDSLNDPCAIVQDTGRIWLRYKRYPEGVHQRKSQHTVRADAGFGGPRNVRVYLTHSDDDGITWTPRRDVTRIMRRPENMAVGSPGVGIQLTRGPHKGRLVFPNYESFPVGADQRSFDNSVSYSDDGGRSWGLANVMGMGDLPGQGNEAQLVELADGSLLFSSRIFADGNPYRRFANSRDGGLTWSNHRHSVQMQTPPCMSSIVRHSWPETDVSGKLVKPGLLLHSVPNTKAKRSNGAIFGSNDEGKTWRRLRVIGPGEFAYSCLTVFPDGDVGCLYEADNYRNIIFKRMSIDWLLAGEDNGARKEGNSTPNASNDSTGFEQLAAGPLGTQADATGQWSAKPGDATIHTQHQRSGKQSLRLLGGKERQVTWQLADKTLAADSLDLWFERWTRRTPFEFRVEALVDGQWQILHHDTSKATVGSFRNRLSLALPSPTPTQFRFTSTTPPNSGIMIDDVSLVQAGPMQITKVVASTQVSPVLTRNNVNPVLDVQVMAMGSAPAIGVSELRIDLTGTTELSDIKYVEVFVAEGNVPDWRAIESRLESLKHFGSRQSPKQRLVFQGKSHLKPGTNHFFVSVKLIPTASLNHRVRARCTAIMADKERVPVAEDQPVAKRIGVAVRKANDDNSRAFRIPGLATTSRGTLVAVYDVRYRGWGDLPNDIDVGMSRSTDGGQTWEPMKVIMDQGDDPDWRYDGIGDPAILVDRNTDTIWVAATWSHGNRSWFGSGPGLKPEETGQLMLVRSDDDGITWSKPINITEQVKKPEWCFILQGPGKGITMRDGTMVFAAQYQDPPNETDKTAHRLPHSTIIYSKDHGKTWQVGTGAFDDTTEAQVVEIEPGVLMLNCRYNRKPVRVVMTTRDMGRTWQEHTTSERSLIEPGSCMASLIDVSREVGQDVGNRLLFSNPDSTRGRHHITIKASPNLGLTWPKEHQLLLDEGSGAGYSCMSMIDENTVGILYEGSRAHMTFQRIPLNDLISEGATPKTERIPQAVEPTSVVSRSGDTPDRDVRRTTATRPNILLIVSEDNGPELGCYGDKYARTPNLDRLATEGVRFETAYVTQAVCSPSRSTIFTGLYPHQNGQIGLATHQFEMFRAWPTTYSILKAAGYRTGLLGKTHVNPPNVIEDHVDFRRITSANFAKRDLANYASESAAFINASDEPFFLTVNFPDAHWPVQNQVQGRPKNVLAADETGTLPYIGFDNQRLRGHVTGFYNCMSRLDECVGELLGELEKSGKAGNTLVIYIGDHGAQFARGKVFVTEGGLRIPFIVRWPGKTIPGLVSSQMVSTIDLLPTIVAAAGATVPKYAPGKDLTGVLGGKTEPIRKYLYAQRNCDSADLHFPQRAIRDKRYKLIRTLLSDRPDPGAHKCLINGASNFRGSPTYQELKTASEITQAAYKTWLNPPEYQLYDLENDPHEFTNRADDPKLAHVRRRLIKRLDQWQQDTDDRLRFPNLVDRLTRENDDCRRQKIRSPQGGWKYAGYLAPDIARRDDGLSRPPKPSDSATSTDAEAHPATSRRPNVLFISVDDWNDWVGCLGNEQAHTPNVDRLASRGLLFTNAHCVAPVFWRSASFGRMFPGSTHASTSKTIRSTR